MSIQQTQPKGNDQDDQSSSRALCSRCGVVIGSQNAEADQVCLICHARLLNDYFQEARKRGSKRGDRSGASRTA